MELENSSSDIAGYTDMATVKIEGLWVNLNDNTYHVLGTEKENENVLAIYDYLSSNYGWTKEAVAGLCGNVYSEGAFNSAQWQVGIGSGIGDWWHKNSSGNYDMGLGLCQWTPAGGLATAWGYNTSQLNANDVNCPVYSPHLQLRAIAENKPAKWVKRNKDYYMAFSDYGSSTRSPEYLAGVWGYCFEKKLTSGELTTRKAKARYYYDDVLNGETPTSDSFMETDLEDATCNYAEGYYPSGQTLDLVVTVRASGYSFEAVPYVQDSQGNITYFEGTSSTQLTLSYTVTDYDFIVVAHATWIEPGPAPPEPQKKRQKKRHSIVPYLKMW